jgi:serine/threonine-protein kinase
MKLESLCPECHTPFTADERDVGRVYVCQQCAVECIVPSLYINPGDCFGHYQVQYPIGAGSSSEVHLATDARTQQQVALKILLPRQAGTKMDGKRTGHDDRSFMLDVKRFLREARNVSTIHHPGLIRIYESDQMEITYQGTTEPCYYLAMEYVEGQTLDRFLDDHGALPQFDALSIVRDVAAVMKLAWETKQLVHRDIKPANIMLTYDGRTKLMDLGISKSLLYDLTQLTESYTILGTPIYMSPEQCTVSKLLDFRSDIYSLGATLYHLVTNRYPFKGKDPMDLVRKHQFAKPVDPTEFNPKLSPAVANLIALMMEKSIAKRPHSWGRLIDHVDELIADLAQTTPT